MLVKLVEVVDVKGHYTSESEYRFFLRQVFVNSGQVAYIRPVGKQELFYSQLNEGKFPDGLSKDVSFTRISINTGGSTSNIVVIGTEEQVYEKINNASKQLLKG
jgi:hypothetical protein